MAGEMTAVVREMFAALDRKDAEGILRTCAEEMQGVDELSRRWLRGRDEVAGYVREILPMMSDPRSELRDIKEQTWGDTGVVTGWLEQDYTIQGNRQHVSAPTTIVLRREGGAWRIALFHSVPLPEAPAS